MQIAKGSQGQAWGLGAARRVFCTQDEGKSWLEPNPKATLNQITGNQSAPWGLGDNYRIFSSADVGKTWVEHSSPYKITVISAGNWDNVWAIDDQNRVLQLDPMSASQPTLAWLQPNKKVGLVQIDAMAVTGAWGLDSHGRVYVTVDGIDWSEPNDKARLTQISGVDDLTAWGLGEGGRVFLTTNRGQSWSEPNSKARLKQVSA